MVGRSRIAIATWGYIPAKSRDIVRDITSSVKEKTMYISWNSTIDYGASMIFHCMKYVGMLADGMLWDYIYI